MNPDTIQYTPQKSSKLPLIVLSLLLIMALLFGIWAFMQMQTYKNNSDKKSAAAVTSANNKLSTQLKADFEQQAKAPYKTFKGSPTYGTVSFSYPKNFSAYDAGNTAEPINAYFFPEIVPSADSNVAYPLRVELVDTDYSQILDQFSSEVSSGTVKASAYIPPRMKNVANASAGTRFDGAIGSGKDSGQGSLVVLKVRDKTLQISTQTTTSLEDFNNIVLSSLTFVP